MGLLWPVALAMLLGYSAFKAKCRTMANYNTSLQWFRPRFLLLIGSSVLRKSSDDTAKKQIAG